MVNSFQKKKFYGQLVDECSFIQCQVPISRRLNHVTICSITPTSPLNVQHLSSLLLLEHENFMIIITPLNRKAFTLIGCKRFTRHPVVQTKEHFLQRKLFLSPTTLLQRSKRRGPVPASQKRGRWKVSPFCGLLQLRSANG